MGVAHWIDCPAGKGRVWVDDDVCHKTKNCNETFCRYYKANNNPKKENPWQEKLFLRRERNEN